MSKLAALKDKLAALKAQLSEKVDKIAFIKAWKEKRAKQTETSAKASNPHSLNTIYREGSTGTRLQVLAFYLFIAVAVISAGSVLKKVAGKLKSSAENEKMAGDISHGIAEIKHKNEEKAEMLALGQFTTNVFVGPPNHTKMMSVDLWIRVSDPETASLVNSRNEVFRDKTMDALNAIFVDKVSLMTELGKTEAKKRIKESLNSALSHGKVEDVFIQNLVFE